MPRFRAKLVPGRKGPYTTWTFVIVPAALAKAWGPGPKAVRGTLGGIEFRGTASRGEGAMRVPIPRELRERAGLARGEVAEVDLERDVHPPRVEIPAELRAVFEDDP